MKVSELIEELQKLDPELPVGQFKESAYDDCWHNLLSVKAAPYERFNENVKGGYEQVDGVHLVLEHFDSGY